MLIPIRYLLNDATVKQIEVASITYWHIELTEHAVLLADGLPAESYLDTGNRAAFADCGTVVAAFPEFARAVWDLAGCAKLVTEGSARDVVYRRLLAQALALGWNREIVAGGNTIWTRPARRRRSN